jgi:hypothetical protein
MTTILQTKVLNGILEDDKNINRAVASAVSQLNAQVDHMMALAAFLFVDVGSAEPITEMEYIVDVTTRFQAQITALRDVMVKLDAVEACGNADNGPANIAAMIATYSLDPSTFTNRYK